MHLEIQIKKSGPPQTPMYPLETGGHASDLMEATGIKSKHGVPNGGSIGIKSRKIQELLSESLAKLSLPEKYTFLVFSLSTKIPRSLPKFLALYQNSSLSAKIPRSYI